MRKQVTSYQLCCLTLVLASVGRLAAARASEPIEMLDCSGLPCVSLKLGAGKPLKLLFDSGDATSILDVADAKKLGLSLQPYKKKDGTVVPDYFSAQVTNAMLGSIALPSVRFLVLDLQKSIGKGEAPASNGFLSYLAFKDRVVTLDYRRHRVTISDAGAEIAAPQGAGSMTYPTFGQKGPPIVATTGFLVNGRPVTVQVDTLYAGTMLIYPTSVEKLSLDGQAGSIRVRRFPFTDSGVDMIEGKADRESFGDKDLLKDAPLYFATPQVHLPDGMFDGTVGGELFWGRSITFDFHANRFWIS
jgi:hypothetical protein